MEKETNQAYTLRIAISHGYEKGKNYSNTNWNTFQKGNTHLWLTRNGFVKAELINNKFTNHRFSPTLEEALKSQ